MDIAKQVGWDGEIPEEKDDDLDLEELDHQPTASRKNGKVEAGMGTRVSVMARLDHSDRGEPKCVD